MKELSTEEKAKAYDEAYKKVAVRFGSNVADEIFLKESEDERIRKWLIGYFNQYIIDGMPQVFGNGLNVKDVIAWLEKQGEQKPVPDWMPKFLDELRSKKNYFDWDEHRDIEGGILAIIKWMNPNYFNGKDGEQEPADKVEPKFHKGEWITIKE